MQCTWTTVQSLKLLTSAEMVHLSRPTRCMQGVTWILMEEGGWWSRGWLLEGQRTLLDLGKTMKKDLAAWVEISGMGWDTSTASRREEVELRIDMKYPNGTELTWTYQLFQVAGPEDKYRLQIGSGVGEGYDAMRYHNGSLFSIYDQDNDDSNTHCASIARKIGWWYRDCYKALLNDCLWNTGSGSIYVPFAEMKIRPKECATSKHKCN